MSLWMAILVFASGFIVGGVATLFAAMTTCFHPDHPPKD